MRKCYEKLKLIMDSRMDEEQFFQHIFILTLLQHNNKHIENIIKNNFFKYCRKTLSKSEIEIFYKKAKNSLVKQSIINENGKLIFCNNGKKLDSLTDYEMYDLIESYEDKIENYIKEKLLVAA
jgi:hypothetical protein